MESLGGLTQIVNMVALLFKYDLESIVWGRTERDKTE